jgi:lipopolysaccharide biosynthesis protein
MPKIILHAHVYYPELWPELLGCIKNCRAEVGTDSLLVVATFPEAKPEMREMLENSLSGMRYEIDAVPNRGYDVGPFVEYVLNRPDFASFDYVIKIHTKQTVDTFLLFHRFRGGDWRHELLSFCSTPKAMHRSLRAFERMPRLGMVAGSRVISRGGVEYTRESINEVLSKGVVLGVKPREATSVLGTMFMARAKCLLPLAQLRHLVDFEEVTAETAHYKFNLAHWFEPAFAFIVSSQGYLVSDGRWPYLLARMGAKLMFIIGRSWRIVSSFVRRKKS